MPRVAFLFLTKEFWGNATMLTVVLIWLYVAATTYLVGYGLLMTLVNLPGMEHRAKKGDMRGAKYEFKYKESFLVTGVVITTVYAQIVSLFSKVGLAANIFLVMVCVVIAVFYREELLRDAFRMFFALKSRGSFVVYLVVFLLFAYGTSHGIMHYDTDLYHAQAIRWIEEYGIVKGLGNLHVRLAYNSAAFPLSALYSFAFLGGQSYHVMSGFFALLLAWQCVGIRNVARRGHLVISDFARLAAIYYLFTVFDEIVSPASDYFLSTIVFYIMICWLDMYVRHERNYVPYILLALLGIYAITIKLSAAPMILLSIVPIYKLIKDRRKEKSIVFAVSVALGFLTAFPFRVINVIISGWLLYPVTFLDFFGFSWKIPKGVAAYDALEIRTFGRGFNDVASYGDVKIGDWLPGWFSSMGAVNKMMLILCVISVLIYIIYFVLVARAAINDKKDSSGKAKRLRISGTGKIFDISHRSMLSDADFLTIGGAIIGCLIFWFLSAPLIRYGVVYVWLVPAVILGRLVIILMNRVPSVIKENGIKVLIALFLLWLIYKGAFLIIEDSHRFNPQYLVRQQDYGRYETEEFELGGYTFYYPKEGDQVGYAPFPAATHDVTGEIRLMGRKIADGFEAVGKN